MAPRERFSKRRGYGSVEKEITIREDAPEALRIFVIQTIYDFGLKPSFLRRLICKVLRTTPDLNNWSEYPNIEGEVQELILYNCEWYQVYDIIEALWEAIGDYQEKFAEEINYFFLYNGIGWKLEDGLIEMRGDERFEKSISETVHILASAKMPTAQNEIKEAILDLSRRPHPDITGAIQHSLACLECLCREVSGDKKSTLGELIKKNPSIVPKPLDQAIEKIWGYTSEQGRHLREGQVPDFLEAELVVQVTAAISTYLGKKLPKLENNKEVLVKEDNLPF